MIDVLTGALLVAIGGLSSYIVLALFVQCPNCERTNRKWKRITTAMCNDFHRRLERAKAQNQTEGP